MIDIEKLEDILLRVQKPARYTGGELGEVKKEITDNTLRFAFCFPDVYEVGMSHLGTSILYHLLNGMGGVYAERCFCPWPDMEQALKDSGMPLFSLETKTPLSDFDIVGFSLSYEMCYTNVLTMLSLGNIPPRANDREEGDPLVIAGGGCAYNPEPLAAFFDLFVIGEAEESLPELVELYKKHKAEASGREEFLKKAAGIQGIYVPSLYDIEYNDDGTVRRTEAKGGAPKSVLKRIAVDFDGGFFPETPIVPYLGVVHDRVTLEIMRGCTRGCRFCQAGFVYRPVRERSAERLLKQAENCIANTGHEEVSLCSLSTGDYTQAARLICELTDSLQGKGVSVAVPSLRIDSYEGEYAQRLKQVRNTGLTFAPEAGMQRLRDIINKNITDDDIYSAVSEAYEGGANGVKLYFMIGLPGETEEDVKGIAVIAQKIKDIYYRVPKERRGGGFRLTVSVSNFVPKPHTPLQWEPQDDMETLYKKQRLLKDILRPVKGVSLSWHDARLSMLEAVFSRGDRRLSAVLEEAHRLGCRFDSWAEMFDFGNWIKAFENTGVSAQFFANRLRGRDEVFPWGMIDSGVSRGYLWAQREASLQGGTTPDCREGCLDCGLREAGLCV